MKTHERCVHRWRDRRAHISFERCPHLVHDLDAKDLQPRLPRGPAYYMERFYYDTANAMTIHPLASLTKLVAPQLDTYIGPETPNPLFITLLRSKHEMPKMDIVLKDIVGLTKINYNSCNYNDSLPVTVRFARMVGEVLTMGSAKGTEKQPFKFYV
jgi:hypothetical protein